MSESNNEPKVTQVTDDSTNIKSKEKSSKKSSKTTSSEDGEKKKKKKSKKPKSSNEEGSTDSGLATPDAKGEDKPKKTKSKKKSKKDDSTTAVEGETKEKKKKSKSKKDTTKSSSSDNTPATLEEGETKPKKSKAKKEKKTKESSVDPTTPVPEEKPKKTKTKQERKKTNAPAASDGAVNSPEEIPEAINNIEIPRETFDESHNAPTGGKQIEVKDGLKLHGRVDYGTKGTKVDVLTNHILLARGDDVTNSQHAETDPWWKSAFIYAYHIDFITPVAPESKGPRKPPPPAPLSKPKKFELIDALFHEDETLFKYKDRIAFNGEETLYSHVPLEEFTLFKGCWDVSNKQKNKIKIAPSQSDVYNLTELTSQIILKFVSKVNLSDIYKGTLNRDPEFQEAKMSAPEKTVLLSLLGVKFLQTKDPIFQLQGNKFFIFNKHAITTPFQMGAYLMHGFTVSLRYTYGAVLLNIVNVCLPFYKHTKYLPNDAKFNENSKTKYSLLDWIIECYIQDKESRGQKFTGKVTSNDINFFIDKNRDIKELLKGLKVNRPYINYSVDADGKSKEPSKMIKPKGIVGFVRETANSLKFRAFPSAINNTAPKDDEKEIMINTNSYFEKKYKIKLQYPDVKLVSLGGRNVVPAECLSIIPGQKLKGQVRDEVAVINFTALRPVDKFKAITNLALPSIRDALTTEEERAKAPHDTSYSFLRVPSRVIDAPVVQFKSSTVEYTDKPFGAKAVNGKNRNEETKGNWDLIGHKFINSPENTVNLRAVFVNDSDRTPPVSVMEELKKSLTKFAKDVESVGVKFDVSADPILINDFGAPQKKFVGGGSRGGGRGGRGGRGRGRGGFGGRGEAIFELSPGEEALDHLLQKVPENTYIVYVLNRGSNSDVYNRLKYLSDLKYGVINSCVVWNKFKKNSTQYNVNVVMKMNLKMEGINHSLSKEDATLLIDEITGLPFMILGADVTHYPEEDQNSIAALVASFDDKFAQFPGDYLLQNEPGEEMIAGIGSLLRDRLVLYQKHNNGKLPPKILFYRDGVSEGQFTHLVNIEVKNLKEAVKKVGTSLNKGAPYNPPMTVLAVVKRNHIRFMPLQQNALNEKGEVAAVQTMGNVMAGTVVDRGVTSSAHFDFFLQSQQALEGTGVPCHYWCIYDENQYSSDYLQQVTHSLCYIFGRSSTSIKVASPVYYADLLCDRSAQFFKANFALANFEFSKVRKNKDDVIPGAKLLPPVSNKVKDLMYYI